MSRPGSRFENGRYHNNHSRERHEGGAALKWLWESRGELTRFARVDFPKAVNDPAFLKGNHTEPTLTWVGHATFLIQIAGLNVLTDPVFSRRVSPFSFAGPERLAPLGLALAELPAIDLVLVSHNHYDHLDDTAVRAIAAANPARGIERVVELDWWQSATLGEAKVTALPTQHFSGRGLRDRNATLWCSLLLEVAQLEDPPGLGGLEPRQPPTPAIRDTLSRAGGKKIYFAGDTGYSPDFADIGAAYPGIDLALLPIGAYDPRWFMKSVHVDPEEAVQMFRDLGARHAAAMHWGTFRLTTEPLDEPPQRLAKALDAAAIPRERFFTMQHGETRRIGSLLQA